VLSFFNYLQERNLEEGNPLSRVHKHEKEGRASSGITAWRGSLSDKENKERMKSFDSDLRSKGYGYRKTRGTWEGGSEESRYVTAKGKNKRHLKAFRRDMENLGKKYDQDSVLIRRQGKSVFKGTNKSGWPGVGQTKKALRDPEVDKTSKTRYNDKSAVNQTEFNPSKPSSSRPRFTTGKGIDSENPNRQPGRKPHLPQ
jgi:hypothetical protein